jgi:hypothetical protein
LDSLKPVISDETKRRWTSRKFWACMIWQVVFLSLFILDEVPLGVLESSMYLLLGGYLVGNVVEKPSRKS